MWLGDKQEIDDGHLQRLHIQADAKGRYAPSASSPSRCRSAPKAHRERSTAGSAYVYSVILTIAIAGVGLTGCETASNAAKTGSEFVAEAFDGSIEFVESLFGESEEEAKVYCLFGDPLTIGYLSSKNCSARGGNGYADRSDAAQALAKARNSSSSPPEIAATQQVLSQPLEAELPTAEVPENLGAAPVIQPDPKPKKTLLPSSDDSQKRVTNGRIPVALAAGPASIALEPRLVDSEPGKPLLDNASYTVLASLTNTGTASAEDLQLALTVGDQRNVDDRRIESLGAGENRNIRLKFSTPDVEDEREIDVSINVGNAEQKTLVNKNMMLTIIDRDYWEVQEAGSNHARLKTHGLAYLRNNPAGRHADEVRDLVEAVLVDEAERLCEQAPYDDYYDNAVFPEGTGRQRNRMDDLKGAFEAYRDVARTHTYEAYNSYVIQVAASSPCRRLAEERTTLSYWSQQPKTPKSLVQIGEAHEQLGNKSRAAEFYQKAAVAGDTEGLIKRGKIYFDSGQKNEATDLFDRAIAAGSRSYEPYWYRGRIEQTKGNKLSAIEFYSQAIDRNESCWRCLHARGSLYRTIPRIPSARKDWCRAISLMEHGNEGKHQIEGLKGLLLKSDSNNGDVPQNEINTSVANICNKL